MATTTDPDSGDDLSSIAGDSVEEESLYDEEHTGSSSHAEPDDFAPSTAAAQAAKALEVAQGSSAFDGPVESPVISPGWPDERALPILDAGPAPPDYYAATTSRRGDPESGREGERTDDEQSSTVAEEFQVLEPLMNYDESVAYSPASSRKRPTDIKHRLANLLDQIRQGRPPSLRFTRMAQRSALLLLFTLIIACAIIISVPRKHSDILHPDYTRLPDEVRSPFDDHPNTEKCHFEEFSEYIDIPFDDLDEFTFEEGDLTSDDAAGLHLGGTFHDDPRDWKKALISGNVVVMETPRRADANSYSSEAPITVRINIATTRPWTTEKIRFVKQGQTVKLQTPVLSPTPRDGQIVHQVPCMDVWVGIYVPQRYNPMNWEVDLEYLNFQQESPANGATGDVPFVMGLLDVQNSTRISTRYGNVNAAVISRSISVETWTGGISGVYGFHDAVKLESLSGDIEVTINPREPSTPHIRSLQTTTDTGETKVLVPASALDNAASIYAEHYAGAGSMSLTYPVGWPANVHTACLLGALRINGRTIPKDPFTDEGISELELATEPDDESYGYLNVHTTWGDIDLVFQEVAHDAHY